MRSRVLALCCAFLPIAAPSSIAQAVQPNYRVEKVDGTQFEIQSYARRGFDFQFLDMKGRRITRPVASIARIVSLKDAETVFGGEAKPIAVAVQAAPVQARPVPGAVETKASAKAAIGIPGRSVFRVRRPGSEFYAVDYDTEGDWLIFLHPEGHWSRHLSSSVEVIERLTAEQAAIVVAKFELIASSKPEIDARTTARTEARKVARRAARWEGFNRAMQGAAQVDMAFASQAQALQSQPSYGGMGFGGYGPDGRAKTQHVNGYYRQSGTYVDSYYRRPAIR